jgi:hypothetical protein
MLQLGLLVVLAKLMQLAERLCSTLVVVVDQLQQLGALAVLVLVVMVELVAVTLEMGLQTVAAAVVVAALAQATHLFLVVREALVF